MKIFNPNQIVKRPTSSAIAKVLNRISTRETATYQTYCEASLLAYQLNVFCKQNKIKFADEAEFEFGKKSTAYLYSKIGKALIEKFGESESIRVDVVVICGDYINACESGDRKKNLNDFYNFLTGKESKTKEKVENILEVKVNAAGEIEVKASEGIDAEKIAQIIKKQLSAKLGA